MKASNANRMTEWWSKVLLEEKVRDGLLRFNCDEKQR
jgi:hypothetical protein